MLMQLFQAIFKQIPKLKQYTTVKVTTKRQKILQQRKKKRLAFFLCSIVLNNYM